MKFCKLTFCLLAASATLSFSACKSGLSDDKLEEKIENALTGRNTVDVEVEKGKVILSGTAASEEEKQQIESIAKTAGDKDVKSIQNNIIVSAPVSATPAPIQTSNDDAVLGAAVNTFMKDFPSVQASVKNGIITVTGTLEQAKVVTLKQGLDNLNPKKVDLSGIVVK
ncbi:BON domain-containing protein [Sphingobacterium thalpophilum]|uniref:BON domain-containing protein n=1 Tax=Sphingobacterium thalpophilum TaxID=259 RepID=A0ABV4HI63_9SPHI|nr:MULTISPECIES: BON domain-containing protein [Sphingobacterium]MCW8311426.1 BON domain-containing protein [Sphingobacterium sp. InxBP1]